MSELSKQALKVENTQSFPNNSAGLITPSDLRAFNENMIDSLVDEIRYNEDSASWNQSIDALEQFTASQQPSFTALNEFTASQLVVNSEVNSFTQSADGRLDTLETEVDSLQTWTSSVNEIADEGNVQGYSTRLHFSGLVSASIVSSAGGPIASIDVLQDDTKLNTSSFNSYTQSNDAKWDYLATQSASWDEMSDITPLNEFTASQLVVNSQVNSFTQSADGRLDAIESELTILEQFTASVNQISDDGVEQGYATRFNFTGNVSASIVQNVGGPIASIDIPFGNIDTGSLLTTASFDNGTRNLTFTKGDSSQFSVNIPDVSGSSGNFATTGSNTFTGNQTISGSLFISGSEVVAGPVTASRLRVLSNTTLGGGLTVSNDTTMTGDLLIQSSSPKLKLRDTSGGGHSDGYDITIDTGSFIINDETHNRPILSDIFNDISGKHTTELTSEIIVISGSDSVTIQGQLTASLQEGYAWVGNSSGVIQAVATSSFGEPIETGSFATTGSNTFTGTQTITGSVTATELVTADIFSNPQTLTGNLTIPTDRNAMVVGTVAVDGDVVIQGNSKLVVIDQISGSGGGADITELNNFTASQEIINSNLESFTSSQEIINSNLESFTSSQELLNTTFATTGSNTFTGTQTLKSTLIVSQSAVSTNEFILPQDGAVLYTWPTQNAFYRMQNGAFQFSTIGNGIGMVFDVAGIDFRNIQGQNQRLSLSNSPSSFGALNQTPYTGSLRGLFYNQTSDFNSPTLAVIGVNESSSFDNTAYIEMNLNVSGSTTIGQAMSLTPQDPLPTGNIGDLAVSGSSLYFYNGSWTLVV